MRKNYVFWKRKKNPYARRLKKSVTIRLDESTVDYFKQLAEETGVGYRTLINVYLCGFEEASGSEVAAPQEGRCRPTSGCCCRLDGLVLGRLL